MKCLLVWNTDNKVVFRADGETQTVPSAQTVLQHLKPEAEALKQVAGSFLIKGLVLIVLVKN